MSRAPMIWLSPFTATLAEVPSRFGLTVVGDHKDLQFRKVESTVWE
jgi:hypothetical protein